jgi:tetratricopeptide (TPR) repeat protein
MKRVLFFIVFTAASLLTYAQPAKVTTAANYLNQEDFVKAKIAIDEASLDPKTQGKPKTLVYKGKIYYAIAIDTTEETAPYRKGAIFVAAESFIQAKEVADSRTDTFELKRYLNIQVYTRMWEEGVNYYNSHIFDTAAKHFAGCADILALEGNLDTLGYYYAANASSAAKDYQKAIEYYNKIKASGYLDGAIYGNIATQYKLMGDTAQAFASLAEGRQAYPENQELLISEFNLYVETGQNEKAIANIDKAIAANPGNASYVFVRGKLKETSGDLAGAEADYKLALEIDPENLDANHDLGALYVNQSISIVEEMNNLPLSATKEYDKKKAELDAIYAKALPYLEKAYELDPSDTEVQNILMKLYLRTNDTEKYNKIKTQSESGN